MDFVVFRSQDGGLRVVQVERGKGVPKGLNQANMSELQDKTLQELFAETDEIGGKYQTPEEREGAAAKLAEAIAAIDAIASGSCRNRLFLSGPAQYQELFAVDYLESSFTIVDDDSIGEFVRLTNVGGGFVRNIKVPLEADGRLPGVIRYDDRFFYLSSQERSYQEAIVQPGYTLEGHG